MPKSINKRHADLVRKTEKQAERNRVMLEALETTAGNIKSLIAACNCTTYNKWLEVVEEAIAKAKGERA